MCWHVSWYVFGVFGYVRVVVWYVFLICGLACVLVCVLVGVLVRGLVWGLERGLERVPLCVLVCFGNCCCMRVVCDVACIVGMCSAWYRCVWYVICCGTPGPCSVCVSKQVSVCVWYVFWGVFGYVFRAVFAHVRVFPSEVSDSWERAAAQLSSFLPWLDFNFALSYT